LISLWESSLPLLPTNTVSVTKKYRPDATFNKIRTQSAVTLDLALQATRYGLLEALKGINNEVQFTKGDIVKIEQLAQQFNHNHIVRWCNTQK
jgi:ABC-type uncharacterized transport system substrate-binding protein